jgi:predicted nuclease of predicted toxin-antitoxin system
MSLTLGSSGLRRTKRFGSTQGANGFVIVTADSDFLDLAEERGAPPKIVRLENCNYKTSQVESLVRRNAVRIAELGRSPRPVLVIRNIA